jgi:hypothetical protein
MLGRRGRPGRKGTVMLEDDGMFGPGGYIPIHWGRDPELMKVVTAGVADSSSGVVRNPHLTAEWARRLVTSESLLLCVAGFLGPEFAVENTFFLTKTPGDDFAVPQHQDGTNETMELNPAKSVAVWLALSDAMRDAGCLEVVPGSQRLGYQPYEYLKEESGRGRPLAAVGNFEGQFLPVPVLRGDGLAFDTRLIHRSGVNRSNEPRIGFNIRFTRADAFVRGAPEERPGWMPVSVGS